MASGQDIPDLRLVVLGIGEWAARAHPGLVTDRDLERVRESNNVLLATARRLLVIAQRAGMPKSEVESLISSAKPSPAVGLMQAKGQQDDGSKVTGRFSQMEAIAAVDAALAHPRTAQRVPAWFKHDWWPGVLRRVASGECMSDREVDVAVYVAADATEER